MPASGCWLGVNVDHVATLRQARRAPYPDPVEAALDSRSEVARTASPCTCAKTAATSRITTSSGCGRPSRTKLNLEMAATAEMCSDALRLRPQDVCLVPERRAELTTEGGLDVSAQRGALRDVVQMLRDGADPREPVHRSRSGARSTPPGRPARMSSSSTPELLPKRAIRIDVHGELARLSAAPPSRLRLRPDVERRSRSPARQRAADRRLPRDARAQHRPRHRLPRRLVGMEAAVREMRASSIRREGAREASRSPRRGVGPARRARPSVRRDPRRDAAHGRAHHRAPGHAGRDADGARRRARGRRPAGGASARELRRGVLVVAGKGNNGGDGSSSRAHLRRSRVPVEVILRCARVGGRGRRAHEPAIAGNGMRGPSGRSRRGASSRWPNDASRAAGVIVDGLFGTGLRGTLDERSRPAIVDGERRARADPGSRLPSGLDADRGLPLGASVQATVTVTFAYPKVGLIVHPGADFAGEVVVADIGIAGETLREVAPRQRCSPPHASARRRRDVSRQPQGNLRPRARARRVARQNWGSFALRTGSAAGGRRPRDGRLPRRPRRSAGISRQTPELMTEPLPDHDGGGGSPTTIAATPQRLLDGKDALCSARESASRPRPGRSAHG